MKQARKHENIESRVMNGDDIGGGNKMQHGGGKSWQKSTAAAIKSMASRAPSSASACCARARNHVGAAWLPRRRASHHNNENHRASPAAWRHIAWRHHLSRSPAAPLAGSIVLRSGKTAHHFPRRSAHRVAALWQTRVNRARLAPQYNAKRQYRLSGANAALHGHRGRYRVDGHGAIISSWLLARLSTTSRRRGWRVRHHQRRGKAARSISADVKHLSAWCRSLRHKLMLAIS